MDSSHIRWLIAILFLAFLSYVVLSDLRSRFRKRMRRSRKAHRPHGFRPDHAPRHREPATSWKTGTRR